MANFDDFPWLSASQALTDAYDVANWPTNAEKFRATRNVPASIHTHAHTCSARTYF